jgi:hypothetical protein
MWRHMMADAARGQTTTEYLMISATFTAIAIVVLAVVHEPFRQVLQDVTQCVIDSTINGEPCLVGAAPPELPLPTPPAATPPASPSLPPAPVGTLPQPPPPSGPKPAPPAPRPRPPAPAPSPPSAPTSPYLAVGNPLIDNNHYWLDYCLVGPGQECGQPAADAYCRSRGYSVAVAFKEIATTQPTKAIGNGAMCTVTQPWQRCFRFEYITCKR